MNAPLPPSQAPVLQVQDLGKEYRLYASPRSRLKALLTGRPTHRSHWALRGVSFALRRGQCLGVIGNNGAGKSSLLKMLAGTMHPSTGVLQRQGRVTAILELGAGFHPDFTGRDNLYFGGSLIGIDAQAMRALEPEIIAFSELGEAIDRPVKTYSSGMAVRLAFALVTAVEPDLLIIDEALAVGDQHFQKKCVERIEQFRRNGCTILFCSHSLYHVRQLCDAALWLDKGAQQAFGPTEEVLAAYEAFVRAQDGGDAAPSAGAAAAAPQRDAPRTSGQPAPGTAGIVSVDVAQLDGSAVPVLQGPDLEVTVVAQAPAGECPSIGVMLEQAHGVGITSVTTHNDGVAPQPLGQGLWRARVRFPALAVHTGEYVLSVYLFDSQGLVVYEQWMRCVHFRHVYALSMPGLVRLPHEWD
ncbi:MAG TPA: ABC transporter ATP-binding protein [Alicycliphilus sp.]|nr:ABC transporter ATP-binding protein [Alicycliphilus sp.]